MKLLFVKTNAYSMLVSVDGEKVRYLTETADFPYIAELTDDEAKAAAEKFLWAVEDDSSWDEAENGEAFLQEINEDENCKILCEIETEL